MDISCKEAQSLMQPYVDRSISDRDMIALVRHIRKCKNCRMDLETSYLAENAIKILSEDRDEVDPARLLEEDIVHMEWARKRRVVLTFGLWTLIVFMGALIAAVVVSLVSPETFTQIGKALIDFFHIQLDFEFWKSLTGM